MSEVYDLVIIGAGPTGLAAAQAASKYTDSILLLDEQPTPGGQIYRASEANAKRQRSHLGDAYVAGQRLIEAFRSSHISYVGGATVWQISARGDSSDYGEVAYSKDGEVRLLRAKEILIASGAQERPMPVAGWTLPGVFTAGAAQILLKESELAFEDAVFCGSGPLLYLLAHQYVQAGIRIKAIIDLTPSGNYLRALPRLPQALTGADKIYQGWQWKREIKKAGVPILNRIADLRILGDRAANAVEFHRSGRWQKLECEHVLLHQGIVPNINMSRAVGCECHWNPTQLCWNVVVDAWYQSSVGGIAVAGDGASIGGAIAAQRSGRIAALGVLNQLGLIEKNLRDQLAQPEHELLSREKGLRAFLDVLFKPAEQFRKPRHDDVILCRCEEVTLGQLREAIALGCVGPNQLKSFSRCGMGPCQGRFCGLTVSELIADITGASIESVGYYRLRSPIKPIALGEFARLTVSSQR
ncbi:MAG: pyruvate/2-oxoglutarate dehydrogenase complex dihydrolipoamide dehydrogenase (E3) component [Gammaproteobacteria bacterium]|jgi:pyruvate/2-oxoglutarate dehydrogenase complex dihydrolipoamide dehydrogenase (E3) component